MQRMRGRAILALVLLVASGALIQTTLRRRLNSSRLPGILLDHPIKASQVPSLDRVLGQIDLQSSSPFAALTFFTRLTCNGWLVAEIFDFHRVGLALQQSGRKVALAGILHDDGGDEISKMRRFSSVVGFPMPIYCETPDQDYQRLQQLLIERGAPDSPQMILFADLKSRTVIGYHSLWSGPTSLNYKRSLFERMLEAGSTELHF